MTNDKLMGTLARSVCRSGHFETGEGTCALICMEALGDPRKAGCSHAPRIHAKIVAGILTTLRDFGPSEEMVASAFSSGVYQRPESDERMAGLFRIQLTSLIGSDHVG